MCTSVADTVYGYRSGRRLVRWNSSLVTSPLSYGWLYVPLPCFHGERGKGSRADEWDVFALVGLATPELAQPCRLSSVYAYRAYAVILDVFESCEQLTITVLR